MSVLTYSLVPDTHSVETGKCLEKGKAINTECLPLWPLYWHYMKEQQMAFYPETLSQTGRCQTAIYCACFFFFFCLPFLMCALY